MSDRDRDSHSIIDLIHQLHGLLNQLENPSYEFLCCLEKEFLEKRQSSKTNAVERFF